MIAKIIPYRRTQRGIDFFDYEIPPQLSLTVGLTVWVPFRNQIIPGLVWDIQARSPHHCKSIAFLMQQPADQLWHSPSRRRLLEWFARYYSLSLPTAWKSLQVGYPKKYKQPIADQSIIGATISDVVSSDTQVNQPIVWLDNDASTPLQHYQQLCHKMRGHLFIVSPDQARADQLAKALAPVQPHLLPATLSMTRYHRLCAQLSDRSTPQVVIGTKKLLQLPLDHAEYLIIDQADHSSHKQSDQNPRYDVRRVAEQAALFMPWLQVVYSSPAPPMRCAQFVRSKQWTCQDLRTQWPKQAVNIIDMNHIAYHSDRPMLSDDFIEAIQAAQRAFLFLNRSGSYQYSICKDCERQVSDISAQCPHCGSTHIQLVRYGTQAVEHIIRQLFTDRRIVRLDQTQTEFQPDTIDQAQIVIGTTKAFGMIDLFEFDLIGIISIDHLLSYPHFQMYERTWQLLTYLASYRRPLYLQTFSPDHPVIQTAATNRYWKFAAFELEMRKQWAFPPFHDRIELITKQTRSVVHENSELIQLPVETFIDRIDY